MSQDWWAPPLAINKQSRENLRKTSEVNFWVSTHVYMYTPLHIWTHTHTKDNNYKCFLILNIRYWSRRPLMHYHSYFTYYVCAYVGVYTACQGWSLVGSLYHHMDSVEGTQVRLRGISWPILIECGSWHWGSRRSNRGQMSFLGQTHHSIRVLRLLDLKQWIYIRVHMYTSTLGFGPGLFTHGVLKMI